MPAIWDLITWNTQGDFTAATKKAVLTGVGFGRKVFMVQEGGVGKAGKLTDAASGNSWTAYAGSGAGAKNERCTNYVLVDSVHEMFCTRKVIADLDGKLVIAGGVAGRAPAAVGLNSVLYISWHAAASSSADADTAVLVNTLDKTEEFYANYHTVVIGGDFNSSPASVAKAVSQGTSRTKAAWNYTSRVVVSSGKITHPSSENELDMFVVLSTGTPAHSALGAGVRKSVVPSDHHAVTMTITI